MTIPSQAIKLIVGLCNPGLEYAATRHNAGAWWVEALAEREGVLVWKKDRQLRGHCAQITAGARLLLPTTFMNDSGRALQAVMQFYKIASPQVMVVHDELDFAPGAIRLKWGGGHGGHNGLRDIIRCVGANFWRLRIGIGHPGHRDRVHGYVLGRPNSADQSAIEQAIADSLNVYSFCAKGAFEAAMQTLHA